MKKILFILAVFGIVAWAAETSFQTDTLKFGRPSAGTKQFKFVTATGSTQPTIKWNGSSSTLQFANDGTTFSDLSAGVPVGAVMAFGNSSCPTGWVYADGTAVNRTGTYAALFAAVGTSNGNGNGSTTFNLPDYRGYFLRGVDGGTARDPDASSRTAQTAGGNTGASVGSVQGYQLQSHHHAVWGSTDTANGSTGAAAANSETISGTNVTAGSQYVNAGQASNYIQDTGGNETRPVNKYVLYCIKF